MNFFATHKHTHKIPNLVLRRAIILSPGKDWTDHSTDAYQYLKKWALEQDKRYSDSVVNVYTTPNGSNITIPKDVMDDAQAMSPGKDWKDKRTKAYKALRAYAITTEHLQDYRDAKTDK